MWFALSTKCLKECQVTFSKYFLKKTRREKNYLSEKMCILPVINDWGSGIRVMIDCWTNAVRQWREHGVSSSDYQSIAMTASTNCFRHCSGKAKSMKFNVTHKYLYVVLNHSSWWVTVLKSSKIEWIHSFTHASTRFPVCLSIYICSFYYLENKVLLGKYMLSVPLAYNHYYYN